MKIDTVSVLPTQTVFVDFAALAKSFVRQKCVPCIDFLMFASIFVISL